jgi:hypothetical protein
VKQQKRRSVIGLLGVFALLISLMAIQSTFAAVRGVAVIQNPADLTKELTWARQAGTIVVQVTDADANVPATYTSEQLTFTACPNNATNPTHSIQVANTPILDKNADGVVNFQDVTISADGNAGTTIYTVDGANGIVTVKCVSAQTPTTQEVDYKSSVVNTIGTAHATASSSIAKVTSQADSAGIGLLLKETGTNTGVFRMCVQLTVAVSNATAGNVANADADANCTNTNYSPGLQTGTGDIITFTYTDAAPTPAANVTDTVTVETTKPVFDTFSPANAFGTQSSRPVVKANVTDTDSGIVKTTITIVYAIDASSPFDNVIDAAKSAEVVVNTTGTLAAITNGWLAEHRLPAALAPTTDAQMFWWVKATDTAGNISVSDRQPTISSVANPCTPASFPAVAALPTKNMTTTGHVAGCQPYSAIIDFTAPDMSSATTGVWWDTAKTTTDKSEATASKAKKNRIAANFNESLDGTTVSISDFTVTNGGADVSVIAADHYAGLKTRVFLTLGSDLAADAKPTVKLSSTASISDTAGNPLSTDTLTAADGIAPTITVTVDGANSVSKSTVVVNFSADEDATVNNSSVVIKPMATVSTVGGALGAVAPVLVSSRAWKTTYTPGNPGVYNILVTATDLAGNAGTKGHATDPSNAAAILFSKDTAIAAPTFSPAVNSDDPGAFIVIDYAAEGTEYGLAANGAFTTVGANVVTTKDSNKTVTLSAAVLDGVDILADINTEDNIKFLYKASGLALGTHKIQVKAEDQAGNKNAAYVDHSFKVVAVAQMTITLRPGWNLVSLPSDPADPAINSVISSTHPIDTVLSYDASAGAWKTSTRDATSDLMVGDLTSVDSSSALWIHTTTFQSLKVTPKAKIAQGAVLPKIDLSAGWNLVPVIKLDLGAADSTATVYLAGTSYTRAYKYDTLNSKFAAIAGGDTMAAGIGFWVYVPKAVSIIPAT